MDSKMLERIHNFIEMLVKQSSVPEEARLEVEDKIWDAFTDAIADNEKKIENVFAYIKEIAVHKVADYYRDNANFKKFIKEWEREIGEISELLKPVYQIYEEKLKSKRQFKDRELEIASASYEPGYLGLINSTIMSLLYNSRYNPFFEWLRREFIAKNEKSRNNANNIILLWIILKAYLGEKKGNYLITIWALVLMNDSYIRLPSKKKFALTIKKRQIYDLLFQHPTSVKEIAGYNEINLNTNEVRRLYLKEIDFNHAISKKLDEYRHGYTDYERNIAKQLHLLKKIIHINEEYARYSEKEKKRKPQ